MSDAEAKDETLEVRREETEADILKMTGQSQVYTATGDTLFPKKINHTRTHALVSMYCRMRSCVHNEYYLYIDPQNTFPSIKESSQNFHWLIRTLQYFALPSVTRMGIWDESCSSCLQSARTRSAGGPLCWSSCWGHLQSHLKLPAHTSGKNIQVSTYS